MSEFPKCLALSHFWGGPVKKTTLYKVTNIKPATEPLYSLPAISHCLIQYIYQQILYCIYLSTYIPTDIKCTINMPPPPCYVSCTKQYSSLFDAYNIYPFTLCTNTGTNITTHDQCNVNLNYQMHHKAPSTTNKYCIVTRQKMQWPERLEPLI